MDQLDNCVGLGWLRHRGMQKLAATEQDRLVWPFFSVFARSFTSATTIETKKYCALTNTEILFSERAESEISQGKNLWKDFMKWCALSTSDQANLANFKLNESSLLDFKQFVGVMNFAKQEQQEAKKPPFFPFDPDSRPKQIWDGTVMFFLMYTTFSVPYKLSYGEPVRSDGEVPDLTWRPLDVFDVFLDSVEFSSVPAAFTYRLRDKCRL